MYGKIFASMYDGTLGDHWQALVTFQQMIVLCDQDGVIDMSPRAISGRTGIDREIIQEGIKILEKPDPHSRTKSCDGRRIERLDDHRDWGWRIVNHRQYRDLASAEDRRSQNRENKRKQRLREKPSANSDDDCHQVSADVSTSHQPSAMSAHTDTDTDNKYKTPLSARGRARGEREDPETIARREGRLPPMDFEPPPEAIEAMASETGLTPEQIADATVKFIDHPRRSATFNWLNHWKNWIRNERGPPSSGRYSNGHAGSVDPYNDEIRRAVENADDS